MTAPDAPSSEEEATTMNVAWLGGESNLLDVEVESKGVADILAALTEDELKEMKDMTMPIRHFRAEKGNTTKAIEKLRSTLKWRKEFGVDDILNCMKEGGDEEIRKGLIEENETGILYVRGYDAEGRAIVCADATVPKSGNELTQFRALVYFLEKAVACTARKSAEVGGKSLEKFIIVVNYNGYTAANRGPLKTIKACNDIMSNHYPERLSNVYLINPPMIFRVFWALIRPFLDPVTREKFVFCTGETGIQELTARVKNLDKLESHLGGTADVRPFDAQEYLNLPLDVCFDE